MTAINQIETQFYADMEKAEAAESRYLQGGGVQALDEAIEAWERILNHPEFGNVDEEFNMTVLNNSAGTYLRRYWAKGNIADLTQTILFLKQLITKTPEDSPDCPSFLNNLATGLSTRYFRLGNLKDLEDSIQTKQKAVELTSDDSPDLPSRLSNLGNGLRDRYLRLGNPIDIENGIKVYQKAIELTPDNSPDLPLRLSNLGNGLTDRYSRLGDLTDLEEGIKAYQKAIELAPRNSPDLPMYLNNIGTGLRDRYSRLGDLTDLEEGIKAYQKAIELTPRNSPDLSRHLNNLGEGLWNRYSCLGNLRDLEEGIMMYHKSVMLTPDNSPDLPRHLNNFGTGLAERYSRIGNITDLEEGIKAYQKAVALIPDNSPDLPNLMTNLGNSLRDRYLRLGNITDLEEGIKAYQKAVALTPDNSYSLPIFLNNLGAGLDTRYLRLGNLTDLEEGIKAYQKAVALTPDNSPDLPSRLNNIGNGLADRYSHLGNMSDLENGINAYQKAAEKGLEVAIEIGLVSARNWLNWAFERQSWNEVEQAHSYAYQASEKLLKNQLLRAEKESWLKDTQGLAALAAYALAKLNKIEDAAVAIERGQARLLSEAIAIDRANLEHLGQTGHADLLEDYRDAVGKIRHWTQQANYEKLKEAQAKLDNTIESIRQIKGYEHFLTSPNFADIRAAAEKMPIAYLMATEAGGLALIVRERGITPVWLSELTDAVLREKLNSYFTAYAAQNNSPDKWYNAIENMTHWLWQAVMQPVIEVLPPDSDLTLIPAGLLNLLPLHAAWTEDKIAPVGKRYASDILTISYAPNARTLTEAMALSEQILSDKLLAIDNPGNDLLNSEYEVQAVSSLFEHKIFRHRESTREAVLKVLPDYNVLHFSCHGKADFEQPLDSGMVMAYNERVTLKDLLNLHLKVRLAVLSACETGISGTHLPDETVNLPSGLMQAGVAGVLASLWAVNDFSTMMLMVMFYEFWQKKNLKPAEALRKAQQWIRDTSNQEKLDYFKKFGIISKQLYKKIGLSEPDHRDFMNPYYWAGFGYTGV